MNQNYDALVIPTGETTFGEYSFPVTNKAVELFNTGKYGCIFITGGNSGFATKERIEKANTEARETFDYIVNKKGINLSKVFYDDSSLESIGNFTFPILENLPFNPNLKDFKNMQVIAQAGHIWRLVDYLGLVMPDKLKDDSVGFYSIPGEHNNGLLARVYHKGIMNAIGKRRGAEEVHEFLMEKHPFYSKGWYDKSVERRKLEMAVKGGLWRIGVVGKDEVK